LDERLGLEMLMRQLEAVVPERHLSRTQLLRLLPGRDAVLLPRSFTDDFEDQAALAGEIRVAPGGVRDDHLVAPGAVLEEVVDPLLLHQAAREGEVGLAVLGAIVTGLKYPLQLVFHVEVGEHLLEDVGNGDVLEDPALRLLRKEPELRREIQRVGREDRVARALRHADADPVEVLPGVAGERDLGRDLLAQERIERDLAGVLGDALEPEGEEARDRLLPRESRQE
jgi:hypothetical protein